MIPGGPGRPAVASRPGWIGGLRPVLSALREGHPPVLRVLVAEGRRDQRAGEVVDEARRKGVPWSRVPRAALDRLAAGAAHQGVAAEVGAAAFADREAVLAAVPRPELLVVLDGVQDPGNLGGILRTAAGAGVGSVFLPRHRAAGLTEGAARAAAGTLGRVPVVRERNLADLVDDLGRRGISCWALDPRGGRRWTDADFTGPTAVVAGSEAGGVRRLVRERCGGVLSLPLAPGVESLNVGAAVAVVLFEVLRQRHGAARGRKP